MGETLDASSPLPEGLSAGLPMPTAAMQFRVVPGVRVLSLRHLAGGTAAIEAALTAHALTPLPEPGVFRGTDPWLVWAGPAEFLLLTTTKAVADGVQQALAPGREALACVLDQSAACLVLELKGHRVAAVLLHLLDANAVPKLVGECIRTRLMDVGAVVVRLDTDRVWLVVDRVHCVYATQWITHALNAETSPT
jgi:heterotetrameric sarcosine oxidase gamma subunit